LLAKELILSEGADDFDVKSFVDATGMETKEYRLVSTDGIFTPNIIKFAIHAYRSGNKLTAVRVMRAYGGLPREVIDGVLKGTIPYREDGDSVLIRHANF
jgi:hypothetical protein